MTLGLASFISIFIPAGFGIKYLGKTDKVLFQFTCFLFIMVIVECVGNYLFYSSKSNLVIYTLSLIFETVCLSMILAQCIDKKLPKICVLSFALLYSIYYVIRYVRLGFTDSFDYEMRIITCILMIFTAGIVIVNQSSNMQVFILYNPIFILSFSLLLYYASTLFVNGAFHVILRKSIRLVATSIWNAHSVVNILTNIFFALSIWLSYRQKKLSML
jgi:hypothetical protein